MSLDVKIVDDVWLEIWSNRQTVDEAMNAITDMVDNADINNIAGAYGVNGYNVE